MQPRSTSSPVVMAVVVAKNMTRTRNVGDTGAAGAAGATVVNEVEE